MALGIRETLHSVSQAMTDPVGFIAGKAVNEAYQSAKAKTIEVTTDLFEKVVNEVCEVALTPVKIAGAPIKFMVLMPANFLVNKCGKKVDLMQYAYTFKDLAEFKKSMIKVALFAAIILVGYYTLPAIGTFFTMQISTFLAAVVTSFVSKNPSAQRKADFDNFQHQAQHSAHIPVATTNETETVTPTVVSSKDSKDWTTEYLSSQADETPANRGTTSIPIQPDTSWISDFEARQKLDAIQTTLEKGCQADEIQISESKPGEEVKDGLIIPNITSGTTQPQAPKVHFSLVNDIERFQKNSIDPVDVSVEDIDVMKEVFEEISDVVAFEQTLKDNQVEKDVKAYEQIQTNGGLDLPIEPVSEMIVPVTLEDIKKNGLNERAQERLARILGHVVVSSEIKEPRNRQSTRVHFNK